MYIAIMGYGVVGSGVAAVLAMNKDSVTGKCRGDYPQVKYILDLRSFPGDPFEDKVISDFNIIAGDSDVEIVVETMGGLHPAYEFVSACLKAGKSVVTSNKELVAMKGFELLETAKENNVSFMFEASVGGGIPVIRPIYQCLAANDIQLVAGILNGTTNFILSKMINENMDFGAALKLAQDNGYAEKDPSADVDGLDACRKICILASLCFGSHIYPDSVYTKGIRDITLKDVEYAGAFGGVVKLIALAEKKEDGRVALSVAPAIVKNGHQLACTGDVFNAVLVRGNAVGDVVFYGAGAGKLPTASAVVADVIDCVRSKGTKPFGWEKAKADGVVPAGEITSRYLVRVEGDSDEVKKTIGDAAAADSFITLGDGYTAFVTEEISLDGLEALSEALKDNVVSTLKILDF